MVFYEFLIRVPLFDQSASYINILPWKLTCFKTFKILLSCAKFCKPTEIGPSFESQKNNYGILFFAETV